MGRSLTINENQSVFLDKPVASIEAMLGAVAIIERSDGVKFDLLPGDVYSPVQKHQAGMRLHGPACVNVIYRDEDERGTS